MNLWKQQLPFFFFDIRRNKFGFLWGLIQIVLAILLTGYMLQIAQETVEAGTAFRQLQSRGSIYQIDCIAEAGEIDAIVNDKNGRRRFREFYTWMGRLNNVERITARSSLNIFIHAQNAKGSELAEQIQEGVASFSTLRISGNFFDFFNLEAGRENIKLAQLFDDYGGEGVIPAVLGNDFREVYAEGELFADDGGKVYRVAGFLKADAVYAAPFESGDAIRLNRFILVPRLAEGPEEGIGYITELVGTYFVADSVGIMEEIMEKAVSLQLPPMEYRSLSEQLALAAKERKNEAITMGAVLFLVFSFAAAGMTSYMIRNLRLRMREFAIHMLCGAQRKGILLRIILQLAIMLFLANLSAAAVFQRLEITIGLLMISLLYGAGIAAYPVFIFRNQEISDIIRRHEHG